MFTRCRLPVHNPLLLSLALHAVGTTSCTLYETARTAFLKPLLPDIELLYPKDQKKMIMSLL